jgi:hypothetical protein
MTRVVWDDLGDKYFEAGIDRGMLYLDFLPGMVWNGLVRITESPSGGQAREFYIDGQKYLNLASLEEYTATIEALSAPPQFAAATGKTELSPGLFVSGQNRQQFAFSYRTLVGNDVDGTDAGYKIHIVYNAQAKTADYVYQTSSDKVDPSTRSWAVTAVPEAFLGIKPTAHYIIDTRTVDPDTVEHLENVLYGTDTTDPRLPSVRELMAILSAAELDIVMSMKKMSISASGSVGGAELSVATGVPRMKKMRIISSGIGISAGIGAPRMKKFQIDAAGSTVGNPVPSGYPDLLPYLITTGAANTGLTALSMNTGDNNGWPVLTDDKIIACGGAGGAQPTSITDLQSNSYTKDAGTNGTPASSIWSAVANSKGLQTAAGPRGTVDTISANYSGTGQAKQWIVLGCRHLGAKSLSPTPTTGTSAAPSITSGTPSGQDELAVVCVVHSNAGGTINTPSGWHLIAKNVTFGTNSLASVFTKTIRGPFSVTFTGALTASTTWSVCMVTYKAIAVDLRGIVGGSIFTNNTGTGAYPLSEMTINDNWHAHVRHNLVTQRNNLSIKRYAQEDDTPASSSNDIEGIIGTWGLRRNVVFGATIGANNYGGSTTNAQANTNFDGFTGLNLAHTVQKMYHQEGDLASGYPQTDQASSIANGVTKVLLSAKPCRTSGGTYADATVCTNGKTCLQEKTNLTNLLNNFIAAGISAANLKVTLWQEPNTSSGHDTAAHYKNYVTYFAPAVRALGIEVVYNCAISTGAGNWEPWDQSVANLCDSVYVDYYGTAYKPTGSGSTPNRTLNNTGANDPGSFVALADNHSGGVVPFGIAEWNAEAGGGSITLSGTSSVWQNYTDHIDTVMSARLKAGKPMGWVIFWMGNNAVGVPDNQILSSTDVKINALKSLWYTLAGAPTGLKQSVSIKPQRAVGGGNATGDTFVRNSLTWWKNNNLDLDIILGNESNINGLHGPFGDGTSTDWQLNCPYSATDAAGAAANYQAYFLRYGRQVVSAGYPAMYNPALSSVAPTFSFMPPRLDTDGHYLLCGIMVDYYFTGDYYPSNNISMADTIAAADGMSPPCPVGIGELGWTNGTRRPKDDNPAGSLAAAVSWFDAQVTGLFKNRPANNLRNLPFEWYANGPANSLDFDTASSMLKAYRRFFDACNPS